MLHLTTRTVAALAILVCGIANAEDTPCEERTPSDCAWASVYPFNTIGNIHWPVEDGKIAVGTAFLVSPHCALTNGHCVYKRKAGEYISAEQTFVPGACRTSWGGIKSQLGERTVAYKRTNNKWADTSYLPKQAVDYGAIQIICPFSEITTFMPLCFGYESDWAHMSGYPTADLPDEDKKWNQWIAYGDVIHTDNRWVRYDARSTGGASGSPVWDWRTDSLLADVYAINSTHWDDCDGGGPRLVWQNESLIRSWMQWEPTLAERIEEGCFEWQIVLWPELIEFFNANEKLRLKPDEVRVENPVAPPPTGPSRRYMQVIERGFYEWVVFDLQPGNPETNHLVQLLAAPGVDLPGVPWMPGMDFNPQAQGWLPAELAIALLSGSAGRASSPVTGIEAVEMEMGELVLIEQPSPDDANDQQDPDPDGEGPIEKQPCLADLNNDGQVDGGDLGMLLAMWGQCTAGDPCSADFNGDGKVDGGDLGLMLGAFGNCP
ncbi:MAG: trypsin-like peptidase domain-containing protein [Phycisphaerales bacterium]|nr:trypsin-like peptidase domain-containing protein [Phycisphaerales bacterium]